MSTAKSIAILLLLPLVLVRGVVAGMGGAVMDLLYDFVEYE